MAEPIPSSERKVQVGPGRNVALQDQGDGAAVLLLHGLTATRRYVVMGSRSLERSGQRVIAVDARGHGGSDAAPAPDDYGYDALAADALAILDRLGIERAVMAGSSMGAHTILRLAIDAPERVAGAVIITPAHLPGEEHDEERLARWDALSDGLRSGGVAGFLDAYGDPAGPAKLRATVRKVIEQRLAMHQHPAAVADALRTVPRSRPFEALADLTGITAPVSIVGSSDEMDPGHPQAVAEAYAELIPDARLWLDEPGRSPRAWQGSQISQVIAEVVGRARRASLI